MLTFKIKLNQGTVNRLQYHIQLTRKVIGVDLSTEEWIELHLKEMAISKDLSALMQGIQQEQEAVAQEALQSAIASKRDDLLAGLRD